MLYLSRQERILPAMLFQRFCLPLLFALMLVPMSMSAHANAKYAALIMEESSGKVIYSRNADKQLYPASLTKIMTLYLLFEALEQNRSA